MALKPLSYSRLPYFERNLGYKLLLSWIALDRVLEVNRKTKEALKRHSDTNY